MDYTCHDSNNKIHDLSSNADSTAHSTILSHMLGQGRVTTPTHIEVRHHNVQRNPHGSVIVPHCQIIDNQHQLSQIDIDENREFPISLEKHSQLVPLDKESQHKVVLEGHHPHPGTGLRHNLQAAHASERHQSPFRLYERGKKPVSSTKPVDASSHSRPEFHLPLVKNPFLDQGRHESEFNNIKTALSPISASGIHFEKRLSPAPKDVREKLSPSGYRSSISPFKAYLLQAVPESERYSPNKNVMQLAENKNNNEDSYLSDLSTHSDLSKTLTCKDSNSPTNSIASSAIDSRSEPLDYHFSNKQGVGSRGPSPHIVQLVSSPPVVFSEDPSLHTPSILRKQLTVKSSVANNSHMHNMMQTFSPAKQPTSSGMWKKSLHEAPVTSIGSGKRKSTARLVHVPVAGLRLPSQRSSFVSSHLPVSSMPTLFSSTATTNAALSSHSQLQPAAHGLMSMALAAASDVDNDRNTLSTSTKEPLLVHTNQFNCGSSQLASEHESLGVSASALHSNRISPIGDAIRTTCPQQPLSLEPEDLSIALNPSLSPLHVLSSLSTLVSQSPLSSGPLLQNTRWSDLQQHVATMPNKSFTVKVKPTVDSESGVHLVNRFPINLVPVRTAPTVVHTCSSVKQASLNSKAAVSETKKLPNVFFSKLSNPLCSTSESTIATNIKKEPVMNMSAIMSKVSSAMLRDTETNKQQQQQQQQASSTEKDQQNMLHFLASPYNMRLQILANFPASSSLSYRPTYRTPSVAVHRARQGCITNVAKSLDLLRQNLQKSINKEIDDIVQKYLKQFFTQAVQNIRDNNGNSAIADEHVHTVCKQILEEAKKMYGCDTHRDPYNIADLLDNSDSGSVNGKKLVPLFKKRRLSDSDSEVGSTTSSKKKKGRPSGNLSSGRSTPSKMSKFDNIKREGPKWDPDRLKEDSLFVMGAKANKALGLGNTRGRLYIKHPDIFKYSGDQEDKLWLYDQQRMPATGGKAYILLLGDIQQLACTEEYRHNTNLQLFELNGFMVPDWMLQKMKLQMISLRTDGGNNNVVRIKTSNGTLVTSVCQSRSSTPDNRHFNLQASQLSPSNTEVLELLSAADSDDHNTTDLSPFQMGGALDIHSPDPSELEASDNETELPQPVVPS